MIAKTPEARINTWLLKDKAGAWQRFGNI